MMINVEYATKKDYPQFRDLHNRFAYLGTNQVREPIVDEARFNEYVARESMFAAYEGDQLVGYAIVDGYDDGTCDIHEIFVAPEHQNKGYGKKIVQKIEEEAKKSGITMLKVFSLWIETDHFWMMKCGFRPDSDGYLVQKIN